MTASAPGSARRWGTGSGARARGGRTRQQQEGAEAEGHEDERGRARGADLGGHRGRALVQPFDVEAQVLESALPGASRVGVDFGEAVSVVWNKTRLLAKGSLRTV